MSNIEPQEVFSIFQQITQIPRPSKHEERISRWLQDFAAQHAIQCVADEAMNVIMRVPATPGYESHPGIILQAHMDMVCEKNSDTQHDFMSDPIDTFVDGEWLKAKETTLGADNGIGIAMALAAITSPNLRHPQIECLFTVDEETGLTGAEKLQDGYLTGKRLINLDSEDDGQIFIGCAGGIDTLAKMHYTPTTLDTTEPMFAARIKVTKLLGGHSGDDINKGRANANKIIVRFLYSLMQRTNLYVAEINGGNLRNAIAREAEALIAVPYQYKEQLRVDFNVFFATLEDEIRDTEPDFCLTLDSEDMPTCFIPKQPMDTLLRVLLSCPHGVLAMSKDMPGLVETSTNLASIKMREGYIEINTSQRSSVESQKHYMKEMVEASLSLVCDEVTHGDGYPGWKPNVKSELLDITKQAYQDLFHTEPKVLAIHAGLECGLFLEKYPFLDMISIGPQMYGVHSPQERLSIPSTARCWQWLQHTLESL